MTKLWLFACIICTWNLLVAVECGVTLKSPSSEPSPHHSPTPAPHSSDSGSDCGTVVYHMMDCAPYLANGGNEVKPESMCCSGFKNIMKKNETCICVALKSTADLGIDLNITRAKSLPSACSVSNNLPKCHIDSDNQPSPAPANPTPKHQSQAPSKSKSPQSAPETPAPAPSKAESSSSTLLVVFSTLISCFIFLLYESL